MKKTYLLVSLMMAVVFIASGCASSTMEESSNYDSAPSYYAGSNQTSDSKAASTPAAVENSDIYYDSEGGVYEEGRKAIKTADARLEVENFQIAYDSIKAMLGSNGYIEESNIWKTPAFYNDEQIMLTNGTVRLRVKAEGFLSFTEGLSSIGTVLNISSIEDDISDMYYDTEARLGLLEDEKARLLDYAKDIDDPEIFFQTQSRITQVIYEMESLQGTLKKWDSKVDYSTVTITINEKHPGSDSELVKPKGFFGKIWENMKDSVGFLGNVLIFLIGILPVLLVLAAAAVIIIIIVKRTGKNRKPIQK